MVFLRSARWKMLISYLVIVTISIILFIVSNSRLIYIVRQTVEQFNEERLGRIQSNADTLVAQMDSFEYSISNSLSVKDAVGRNADSTLYQKLMSDLQKYCIYNDYIKDIIVYLPKKEFVVSTTDATDFIYYGNARFLKNDYWQVQSMIQKEYNGVYIALPFKNQNDKLDYPVYAKTAMIDGVQANIFIVLNIGRLLETTDNNEKVFILNEDNQLMGISALAKVPENLSYEDMCDVGGVKRFSVSGNNFVIQYTSSSVLPWKYVLISAEETFEKHIKSANFTAFIALFLLLLMSTVMAFLLSKNNYKPIKSLVNMLERKEIPKEEHQPLHTEYQYITEKVGELVSMMKKINTKQYLIRENLLENILLGRLLDQNLQEDLKYHDIEFTTDLFAVLRIEVKEPNDAFEGDVNLLYYAIKNVSEELLNQTARGYATESGGVIYLLVNLNDDTNADERLRRSAETVGEVINKVLQVHPLIVVSSVREGIEKISESYYETVRNSQYQISDAYGVLMCKDLGLDEIDTTSFFSTANMLINDCNLGDVENAVKNMQQLIELAVSDDRILSDYSVYQLYLVLSAIKSEETSDKEELLAKLKQQKVKEKLKEFCTKLIKEICASAKMKNQTQIELIKSVETIVSENILNPQLNLNYIAYELKMNTKYLSRAYNQATGHSLVDYINAERINQAKEMLNTDPKMRIEDLYQKCGFTNIRTFRRMFIKYTGVSPSDYKTTALRLRKEDK